MNIWLFLILFAIFVVTIPFHSHFVSQYIFNTPRRTRKKLMKYYNYFRKHYPEEPEEESLRYAMRICFIVHDRDPDRRKPKHFLTKIELDEIIGKARNIDQLINIVVERGFSPDVALCGF